MNRTRLYRIFTVVLVVAGVVLVWMSRREHALPTDPSLESVDPSARDGGHDSAIAKAFNPPPGAGANPGPAVQQVGGNLFAESGAWLDQTGAERRLSDLRGHPVVFTFIYTTCDDACPLIVKSMQKGLARVPESRRKDARFVLFSFDPETDKPPVLAEYAKTMELPGEQWLLLTAPDESVLRIADRVAFRYQRIGKHFSHNAVIGVATGEGDIVGWFADERITQAEELGEGLTKALSR